MKIYQNEKHLLKSASEAPKWLFTFAFVAALSLSTLTSKDLFGGFLKSKNLVADSQVKFEEVRKYSDKIKGKLFKNKKRRNDYE